MMKITTKQAEKVHVLLIRCAPTVIRTATAFCLTTAKHTAACSLSLSTGFTATTSKKQYYSPIKSCTNKSKSTTN